MSTKHRRKKNKENKKDNKISEQYNIKTYDIINDNILIHNKYKKELINNINPNDNDFEQIKIWAGYDLLKSIPNYPWLDPQALTGIIDSTICDTTIVGYEEQIDQITQQTIWVYWSDTVINPING